MKEQLSESISLLDNILYKKSLWIDESGLLDSLDDYILKSYEI